MTCRVAFICGGQGVPIALFLQDHVGGENLKVFASSAANAMLIEQGWDDHILIASEGQLRQEVSEFSPDVVLVMTYLSRIDVSIGKSSKYGIVNIHPSLLPKYRGGAPIFYALKNNETEVGLSYHFLTERFDQGPIIAQSVIKVAAADCASSIWVKVVRKIMSTLPGLISSRAEWRAIAKEQDEDLETSVGFPSVHERTLSNQKTIAENLATIRACGKSVGARLELSGDVVRVTDAVASQCPLEMKKFHYFVKGAALFYQVEDGWLEIKGGLVNGRPASALGLLGGARG